MSLASPYDALLLLSFGGPEGPDDVLPFLENVTRGRGIPRERLVEVGAHYFQFGGVSPINQQCRDLIAAIGKDFATAGVDLPIYWGNRNWDPYLTATVAETAPVFLTSFVTSQGLFLAQLCAAAFVVSLPVLIAGWAAQDKLVRGLSMGAVK